MRICVFFGLHVKFFFRVNAGPLQFEIEINLKEVRLISNLNKWVRQCEKRRVQNEKCGGVYAVHLRLRYITESKRPTSSFFY